MSFDLPNLPDGWEYRPLNECALGGSITYGVVQPGTAQAEGIPLVRVNNFREGRLDLTDLMKISPDIESKYSRTRLKGGEVLLTLVGSVGQVAMAPESVAGFNVARAVGVIHPISEIGPEWISACLRSPASQSLLISRANTTVQTTINLKDVRALPIPIPPKGERDEIARVISTLDDRIDLLRETNATLEAIAQALFKSWFVDFDPVRAKSEGREPEGLDPETAALFPDGFEESELGLVPRGWKRLSFTSTVDVIGGGTPKTSVLDYWGGDIPWFSVVDAPASSDVFVIDTEKHITELGLRNSSTNVLPVGTTIISARGTVGRLALVGRAMAMNQSCYGLRGKADDAYFTYFSTYRLVETLKQRTHGSVFDTITRDTLAGVALVYPQASLIQAFEAALSPLMERSKENQRQAETLASLRDRLLPRLISGQLRLPEAIEAVEDEIRTTPTESATSPTGRTMLERPSAEVHLVKNASSSIPTVEVDVDSVDAEELERAITRYLTSVASAKEKMRATIYRYETMSVNFHEPTNSIFFGVAGPESILHGLQSTIGTLHGVRSRFSDYISISQSTVDCHVEDGMVWRQLDVATWYADVIGNSANDELDESDEDDETEDHRPIICTGEPEDADETTGRIENPTRFRSARSDASVRSIRQKIEEVFGLPEGSVALCGPDGKALRSDAKIGTLRRRWE